ncbi:MAG: hypothetical protein WDZ93_00925 [Candidatus Paceibacterota bacterium]
MKNKFFALAAVAIGLSVATPAFADHTHHGRYERGGTNFSLSVTIQQERPRYRPHCSRCSSFVRAAPTHPAFRHYPSRHDRAHRINRPRGNVTIIKERTTIIIGR